MKRAAAASLLVCCVLAAALGAPVGALDPPEPPGVDDDARPIRHASPDTLGRLLATSAPGTTIELDPGEYAPQVLRDRHDLVLRAAIEGTVTLTADSHDDAIALSIADSSDIVVEGVRIERARHGIIIEDSAGVAIRASTIADIGQRGIWVHSGSSDVTIEHTEISHTGQRDGRNANGITYRSLGEAIYLGYPARPDDNTHDIALIDNHIHSLGSEAIDVKAGVSDVVIDANAIHDVQTPMGAVVLHPGTEAADPGDLVVRRNVITAISTYKGRGGHGLHISTAATVDANVVADVGGNGLVVREVTGDVRDVTFRNNTIFDTGRDDFVVRRHQPALPAPQRWGNGGGERLPGFPNRWIAHGLPTSDLAAFLTDRALETAPLDELELDRAVVATPVVVDPEPQVVVVEPEPQVEPEPEPQVEPEPEPQVVVEPRVEPEPRVVEPEPQREQPTAIPVYDTAWQMFVRATPDQADTYFDTLSDYGFAGSWAALIHHAPATYLHDYNGQNGRARVGRYHNGQIELSDGYISHVRQILDAAHRHDTTVGVIVAWQNTYLPGGDTGNDELSNRVEGTLTTANAYAYARHVADAFGDHPAVGHWVFGGDAGKNNTDANKEVWRIMARAFDDAGLDQPIGYHTPTAWFDHLNYAGETWLDFIAPETGHSQGPDRTEAQLRLARETYRIPTWQGESRYYNITFDWVKPQFRNPGRAEVVADARAAARAGVSGYVYGDAGRWAWCLFQNGDGDTTPCNPDDIAASFGQAERDVIAVFR